MLFLAHFSFRSIINLDYEQCTYRAYSKLTAQIKPDLEACEKQKEELYD